MRTVLSTVGFVVLLAGCHRTPERAAAPERPPVNVQRVELKLQRVPDIHEAVGTVRPTVSANVSAKVMATIEKIHVRPGDKVVAGQRLVELDDRDLRAEYDRAKADFDRFKTLLDRAVATRAEFDAMQSRFRIAEASLSYAILSAPFDGLVAQKLCDVGDLATPGRTLFVVEQPGHFRLEASVPERYAGALVLGKNVEVAIDALGCRCSGPIGEIIPAADPASRSFLIKINLKDGGPLKSGLFGRALLPVGEREVLFAPKSAIHERGQLTFVYVAADGRARMRLLRTGKTDTDKVEVLSGLEPGESVLVGEVADGQRVQP